MPTHNDTMQPFDPIQLGRRLGEARKNARFTQEEAADHLGILRTAIAQIEMGVRAVSTDELYRLARFYDRSVEYFFRSEDDATQEDALTVLGRMAPEIQDHPETGKAIGRLVNICQVGADLKCELGWPGHQGPPSYSACIPKGIAEAVTQGADVAEQERCRLALGAAPVADMHELIAAQGVWAASDQLPQDISGLFFNHKSTGMVVVVNHGHNGWRQRFSYAHEYAHALLDRDLKVTYTSRDNSKTLIEARANAFAGAFLMPKRGVEAVLTDLNKGRPSKLLVSTYDVANESGIESERRTIPGSQLITVKDVAHLAMYFDVSFEVACYRTRSLGYINQAELEALLARKEAGYEFLRIVSGRNHTSRSGKRHRTKHDDPNDSIAIDRHIIGQLLPLVIEAYQREVISRGRLLEISSLLRISGASVLEIAQTR